MLERRYQHTVELFQSARALLVTDRQAEDAVKQAYLIMPDLIIPAEGRLDERGLLFAGLVRHLKMVDRSKSRQSSSSNCEPRGGLISALRSLPVDQAVILLLAEVHAFGREEISVILAVAEHDLSPQLSAARKALRLADAREEPLPHSKNLGSSELRQVWLST